MSVSAAPTLLQHDLEQFLLKIESGGYWTILSSLNFEECSVHFVRICLARLSDSAINRVNFKLLRLASVQASRWSVLETVKSNFEDEIRRLADAKDANLEVLSVPFPVSRDAMAGLISDACSRERCHVAIDVSGFPREMAVYGLTILYGVGDSFRRLPTGEKFAIVTEPEHVIGRDAQGPSSVGRPRYVFNDRSTIREVLKRGWVTALVYCGPEGFEARNAVDEIRAPGTQITAVVPLDVASVGNLLPAMAANQSLISEMDALNLSVSYSMSTGDFVRTVDRVIEDAITRIEADLDRANALLVAPFGSKTHVVGTAYCGAKFLAECAKRNARRAIFDVIVLSASQYTSLHSHGCKSTLVFELCSGGDATV